MLDFLACLSEREVEIGGKTYLVRPPTLEEALRVMAALQSLGDPDAWKVLESACRSWLPVKLCEVYFGPTAHPPSTVKDIGQLLSVGVRDRDRHEKDKKQVEEEAKRRSWFAVIADYSDALSTSPDKALATYFPLFIGLCAEVFRIGQRRQADFMMAYAVARTGEKKSWNAVLRNAGYAPRPEDIEIPEWAKPDSDFIKEQKAKAKAYRLSHMKKGKA